GCATVEQRARGGGPLRGCARVAHRLCIGHRRDRGRCRDRCDLPAGRTAIAGCRRGRRGDILLTPAAPVKPYPVEMNFPNAINGRKCDHYTAWIAPAFLITLVSLRAGSAPAGKTRDGLPVGLQIVAPRFEEPRILSLAKLVQQAHPI